jgi:putative pre-16S rRNA nuclease
MTDPQSIMAIDHGQARIGIALSDHLRLVARPVRVISHSTQAADFEAIAAIVREFDAARVVIGIPTGADGGQSRQSEIVIKWASKLARHVTVPIVGWDESYTSVKAAEISLTKRMRHRAKGQLDDVAAAMLLQDYLDSGGTNGEPGQPIEALAKLF